MRLLTRLFALVILTLLPVIGIEVYDEIDARSLRAKEAKDQALRLVRLMAQEQSRVIEGARQLLTALGKAPVVQTGAPALCNGFFADLVHSFPQYLGLVAVDLSGHQICSCGATEPAAVLGDRPFFKLAIANRNLTVGEYDADDVPHRKVIHLAQPYYDAAGNVRGVVAAALSLDWLNSEIARNPWPQNATVSIVDRQGTILARYPASEQFVGTQIPGQSHAHMLSGGEGVGEAVGFDGITRTYSYSPLPGGPPGLTLSVGLDKAELLKGSEAANRRDVMVIAGSSILALLLAGIGARSFIGRPIRVLLDAAEHWRQGDLAARVPCPDARSEFGRLGVAFNAMAAAIGAREHELERRVVERTEALTEAMEARHVAEATLHESRKLETVGRLTGGVAHDFNNLLAAIVGNIELARTRLSPGHPGLARLDAAMQSANRGAALVQQLLAFARRQNLRPKVVDLNRYIRDSEDMLQRLLRADVVVETRLSSEAWLVRVDPNQLEAAILNLAINARDAMPNGGLLGVRTKNVSFTGKSNQVGLDGDFVALTVSDSGIGIPREILEKVFDPFFTTKEIGAGSGLGLSMVQGFARQSSGSVFIESDVGQGTSVTLYLPRTTEVAEPVNQEVEEELAAGTVLLVDDDVEVMSATVALLELTGCSVMTTRNAAEAIACFRQDASRVDILITGLGPAHVRDGIELATALRAERPELPVLLITGYGEARSGESQFDGMAILTKPFDRAALVGAVREAKRLAGRQVRGTSRAPASDSLKPAFDSLK
jgi:signal transduction histidine kinase/CheY-like chemotaxis protein